MPQFTRDPLVRYLSIALSALLLFIPIQVAVSNIMPDADGKDDSAVIVERIKEAMPSGGLISIEQKTGRLLYNPALDKLLTMNLKQKFFLPAMIINQTQKLSLISEVPFSCFMLSGSELNTEHYKGFRQYETAQYIRQVRNFPVARVLICSVKGSAAKTWGSSLRLEEDRDPFVFEEHTSMSGEHFFYFLNTDGSFEMYM